MRLSIEEPACLLPSKEAESPEMRISIRLTRNNDPTDSLKAIVYKCKFLKKVLIRLSVLPI